MKQFQLLYSTALSGDFCSELSRIRDSYPGCVSTLRVFYDNARLEEVRSLRDMLVRDYPEFHYYGCASNANIHSGKLEEGTVEVVCTVFEDSTARVRVLQYELDTEDQSGLCDDLLRQVGELNWVKGIELLITLRGMSTTYFCDRLSELPEDIQIFGGCAFNKNLDTMDVSIFSEAGDVSESGVVFVLMGGEELNISTTYITGWKPLGQKMVITHAEKNRLYELGGVPAYELYYRYLRIDNDEHFYHNALEFPIFYERNDINILRVPQDSMADGSLIMTSDMTEGSVAQLSYGDPQTILKSIFAVATDLADFVPEGIVIYDCASRRSFWGEEDIDRESLPFQTLADTAGFYTAGEFHRKGRSLNQHNVTLVIVGMREGDAGSSNKQALLKKYDYDSNRISMVRRLANFIDEASAELERANKRLSVMAKTDELTGILNRRAMKDTIFSAADRHDYFSLIMLDLDDFKRVNDTYGHDEGDRVLIGFSRVMEECGADLCENAHIGRWGGEEFMIYMPEAGNDEALILAEEIRIRFAQLEFEDSGHHTVSCGVTEFRREEAADEVCIRVDHALYQAKRTGRNRTCIM